jgi:PAS domain S-box-containing protein
MPADSTSPSVPDLQRRVDQLVAELCARTSDHEEALRREAAIAEILQVTNASGGDLALVLNAIIEKATRLCSASYGYIWTYDGESARAVAVHGDARFEEWLLQRDPVRPSQHSPLGRVLLSRRLAHVVDAKEDETYRNDPRFRDLVDRAGLRTLLHVPLRKGDTLLGVITVYRRERQAFTDQQIRLLESFAEQAVIAMENARLLDEQREALEQQTATAEVLEVINSSPGDVAPVFDAMLEKAMRLCAAAFGYLMTYDGKRFAVVANKGLPPRFADYLRNMDQPRSAGLYASILAGAAYAQESDLSKGEVYRISPLRRALVDLGGAQTGIVVSLRKDEALLGVITIYRQEVRPFASKEITLLESFAAQAVIAIENARLINEQREALEQQTATAEILTVISQSPTDVGPVLSAVAKAAMKFCGASDAQVSLREGDEWFVAAHEGPIGAMLGRRTLTRHTAPSRAMIDGKVVQIVDLQTVDADEFPEARELGAKLGFRSALAAPLLRDDVSIGAISLRRGEAGEFGPRQVELLKTFAAQAVIAIENVRLFTELRESLEQQTATAEVLQVINSSPEDLTPVFDAMLAKATRLSEAAFGILWTYDGERFQAVAFHRVPPAYVEFLKEPQLASPVAPLGRVARGEAFAHVPDLAADEYQERAGFLVRQGLSLGGFRTVLAVPMRKDALLLGAITIYRREVQPFSDKQIALLQSFAAQAVIAMENARLMTEQREALEQQTATAEVLQVINSSPGNLGPVFGAILEKAMHICGASFGGLWTFEADRYVIAALHGVPKAYAEFLRATTVIPGPGSAPYRFLHGERSVIQNIDLAAEEAYRAGDPQRRALVEVGGARSALQVPLCKEDTVIGVVTIYRQEVRAFNERQIALLQNFAAQAVVAMENARLFEELRDRQAELRVTFDNMGDGVAMFDAEPRLAAWNRNFERIIGVPEARLAERPSYAEYLRLLAERGEFGTENVEAELASRLENTDRELRLERTRADGTVIEVRRNAVPGGGFVLIYSDVTEQRRAEAAIRAARDAAEAALERQTATADILKVIASSPTDVRPVLNAVVKAAVRFCSATDAMIQLREEDSVISVAHEGPLPYSAGNRRSLDRSTAGGRSIVDAQTCHLPDMETLDPDEFATGRRLATQHGFRAAVAAPLKREGTAVGSVILRKVEPGPFTPQQIQLLEIFAAQGVIAIENVRLFTELKESLEQQTATSEILRAISQSPTDVQPVLKAVVGAARRFCGADDAMVVLREETEQLLATHEGSLQSLVGTRLPLDRSSATGRATIDGQTFHVPDVAALDPAEHAMTIELTRRTGIRSLLAAPMLREGQAIGCVLLRRPTPGVFTPRQIELLEAFAAQAVIAIENVRLFTELRDSLGRLKAAQANLIQAEKMASLGQLSAGIAHEIKNPLNFVNNFAGLSVELLGELKAAAQPALAVMSEDARAEFGETIDMITSNLGKIAEHGRRADGIVKSMLSHSRGGTGDWQQSDINALIEEALNLAYHGARAQDKEFNVTLERDFAPEAKPIEVVPQDVTRVFLNLFGNGFYAANKRRLAGAGAGYRPTLTVSTRDLGEAVEVRVRDNGIGISPELRDKLFQPFFTTKPTGEGTGLGLSISYDIVTQQHGGSIEVESEPGSFTEFTVRLPRRRRAA